MKSKQTNLKLVSSIVCLKHDHVRQTKGCVCKLMQCNIIDYEARLCYYFDMKTPYVLFEGLDLAGKSTAVHDFVAASEIDWLIRQKTVTDSNIIRELGASLKRDTTISDATRGWLYYASFRADLETMVLPTVPTIQESVTAIRSIAFHAVLGDRDLAEEFRKSIDKLDIFSNAFILTASIKARQLRLEQRMHTNPEMVSPLDLVVRDQPDKFKRMEEEMIDAVMRVSPEAVVIDTSITPRNEVVDIISERVKPNLN